MSDGCQTVFDFLYLFRRQKGVRIHFPHIVFQSCIAPFFPAVTDGMSPLSDHRRLRQSHMRDGIPAMDGSAHHLPFLCLTAQRTK